MHLGLHVSPEQLEWGIFQKLLLVHGICSSSWAALSGLSGRGRASLAET
ncbi:mCG147349 [Mus musculus]|nr:mCG147349 [Mus musculus]